MNKMSLSLVLLVAACASSQPDQPKAVIPYPVQPPRQEQPVPVIPYPDRPAYQPPMAAPMPPVQQEPLDVPPIPRIEEPLPTIPPMPEDPAFHLPFQYQSPQYNPPAQPVQPRMEVHQMEPAAQIMLVMVSMIAEMAVRSSDPGYAINQPRRIVPGYHARFHY